MGRAPKKCANHGCEERVTARTYCPTHAPKWQGAGRGSTRRGRKIRAQALERDRGMCVTPGCGRPATEVDHIHNRATQGPDELHNLQSLCAPHHAAKTAREAAQGRGATFSGG